MTRTRLSPAATARATAKVLSVDPSSTTKTSTHRVPATAGQVGGQRLGQALGLVIAGEDQAEPRSGRHGPHSRAVTIGYWLRYVQPLNPGATSAAALMSSSLPSIGIAERVSDRRGAAQGGPRRSRSCCGLRHLHASLAPAMRDGADVRRPRSPCWPVDRAPNSIGRGQHRDGGAPPRRAGWTTRPQLPRCWWWSPRWSSSPWRCWSLRWCWSPRWCWWLRWWWSASPWWSWRRWWSWA